MNKPYEKIVHLLYLRYALNQGIKIRNIKRPIYRIVKDILKKKYNIECSDNFNIISNKRKYSYRSYINANTSKPSFCNEFYSVKIPYIFSKRFSIPTVNISYYGTNIIKRSTGSHKIYSFNILTSYLKEVSNVYKFCRSIDKQMSMLAELYKTIEYYRKVIEFETNSLNELKEIHEFDSPPSKPIDPIIEQPKVQNKRKLQLEQSRKKLELIEEGCQ